MSPKNAIKIQVEDNDELPEPAPAAPRKRGRPKSAVTAKAAVKTRKKAVSPEEGLDVAVSDKKKMGNKGPRKTLARKAVVRKDASPKPVKVAIDAEDEPKEPSGTPEPAAVAPEVDAAVPTAPLTDTKIPVSDMSVKPGADKAAGTDDILAQKGNLVKEVIRASNSEASAAAGPDPATVPEIEQTVRRHRSIGLYRKIATVFIALTLCLLAVVFYFSFVKVTIILIPNQERVGSNMLIDVLDTEREEQPSQTTIRGAVRLTEITHEKTYPATGEEVIGEEAVGRIVIYNNYDKNQPLVATTRLATPDNKLFRLKDTVNVPAGGQVEADIYADKPSEDMAVGPTKWTIPGLWAGLQDKIYAENKEAIVYQQRVKKHVSAEDIDNSRRDLRQELLAKAKEEVSKTYDDFSELIYKIDEDSILINVGAKTNDEIEEFSASMEANVVVVAFSEKDAGSLAKQKFLASLPGNKELISFNEGDIIYSLSKYDENTGEATVNATFEGKVSLKENSDVIELDKILGLNQQQLTSYLSGLPEIAGFEVKYFPSFIKRVPKLVDRIEVIVRK